MVSVRAFMNSRKAKQLEEQQQSAAANGPVLGEESIRIASTPMMTARESTQVYEQPPPTIKTGGDNKEYTL
jgi:hypothetical protein